MVGASLWVGQSLKGRHMEVRNSIYLLLFGFLFFIIVQKLPFPTDVKWVVVEFRPMVVSILACYCILLTLPKDMIFENAIIVSIMVFEALQFVFCIFYTTGIITIGQTNYVYPVYLAILLLFINKIFKKAEKESL